MAGRPKKYDSVLPPVRVDAALVASLRAEADEEERDLTDVIRRRLAGKSTFLRTP